MRTFLASTLALALACAAPGCAPAPEDPPADPRAAVDAVWETYTRHGRHDEAIEALTALADDGNPLAMRALGTTYMAGVGVEPDEARAAEWFRRAAALGDSVAQARVSAYDAATDAR